MNSTSGNNSKKASESSQGNENLEPRTDKVTAPFKGADAKGPSKSKSSSMAKISFWNKPKDGSKANSGSQQSSSNDETPSLDDNGKATFKPRHLGLTKDEAKQSWTSYAGDGPAELLEACWLDVNGSLRVREGKTYEISFKLSMNEGKSFGWKDPVSVMARIGKDGEYKRVEVDLSKLGKDEQVFPSEKLKIECKSKESTAKKEREKKGESTANEETMLYFGLYEVWTNKWKGGLLIHEAIVQEQR